MSKDELNFEIDHADDKEFESIDSEGSWAVSYGDMVTLLLAFFILFFNLDTATQALKKKENENNKIQISILDAFGGRRIGNGDLALTSKGVRRGPSDHLFEKDSNYTGIGAAGNRFFPTSETDAVKKSELSRKPAQIVELDDGTRLERDGGRIVVDFGKLSFFRSGEIELTQDGKKALSEFSKKIASYVGRHTISIRAFTDGRPVRQIPGRRFKDNIELSALRAIQAMRHLQHDGVPLDHMRIGGNGELKDYFSKKIGDPSELEKLRGSQRKIVLVIEPIQEGVQS